MVLDRWLPHPVVNRCVRLLEFRSESGYTTHDQRQRFAKLHLGSNRPDSEFHGQGRERFPTSGRHMEPELHRYRFMRRSYAQQHGKSRDLYGASQRARLCCNFDGHCKCGQDQIKQCYDHHIDYRPQLRQRTHLAQ